MKAVTSVTADFSEAGSKTMTGKESSELMCSQSMSHTQSMKKTAGVLTKFVRESISAVGKRMSTVNHAVHNLAHRALNRKSKANVVSIREASAIKVSTKQPAQHVTLAVDSCAELRSVSPALSEAGSACAVRSSNFADKKWKTPCGEELTMRDIRRVVNDQGEVLIQRRQLVQFLLKQPSEAAHIRRELSKLEDVLIEETWKYMYSLIAEAITSKDVAESMMKEVRTRIRALEADYLRQVTALKDKVRNNHADFQDWYQSSDPCEKQDEEVQDLVNIAVEAKLKEILHAVQSDEASSNAACKAAMKKILVERRDSIATHNMHLETQRIKLQEEVTTVRNEKEGMEKNIVSLKRDQEVLQHRLEHAQYETTKLQTKLRQALMDTHEPVRSKNSHEPSRALHTKCVTVPASTMQNMLDNDEYLDSVIDFHDDGESKSPDVSAGGHENAVGAIKVTKFDDTADSSGSERDVSRERSGTQKNKPNVKIDTHGGESSADDQHDQEDDRLSLVSFDSCVSGISANAADGAQQKKARTKKIERSKTAGTEAKAKAAPKYGRAKTLSAPQKNGNGSSKSKTDSRSSGQSPRISDRAPSPSNSIGPKCPKQAAAPKSSSRKMGK